MKCRYCEYFNWTCSSSHPMNGCYNGLQRIRIKSMKTRKVKIELVVDLPDTEDLTDDHVRQLLLNSLYKSQSELEVGNYTLANPKKHLEYTRLLNAVANTNQTRIKVG